MGVPDVEVEAAIVPERLPDPPTDLDQRRDVVGWGLLLPDLPVCPVIALVEVGGARDAAVDGGFRDDLEPDPGVALEEGVEGHGDMLFTGGSVVSTALSDRREATSATRVWAIAQ